MQPPEFNWEFNAYLLVKYIMNFGELETAKPPKKRRRFKSEVIKFVEKLENQLYRALNDKDLSKLKTTMATSDEEWVPLDAFVEESDKTLIISNGKLLQNVIKKSEIIELNEGATFVRRRKNLTDIRESLTIFVDNVPFESDTDLVDKCFNRFGRILQIQLPEQHRNVKENEAHKRNKGFCFITFNKASSVHNVLSYFSKHSSSVKGKSVGVTEKCQKQQQHGSTKSSGKKRAGSIDNCEAPATKKKRLDHSTLTDGNDDGLVELKMATKKSRCRRSNKNHRIRRRLSIETHKQTTKGLTVYSWTEWNRLKKDYLSLQKENYSNVKKDLQSVPKGINSLQKNKKNKRRGREKIFDKAALAWEASTAHNNSQQ